MTQIVTFIVLGISFLCLIKTAQRRYITKINQYAQLLGYVRVNHGISKSIQEAMGVLSRRSGLLEGTF